jgi:hypothetical protein
MASQNKHKKSKNANFWQGVKINGSQRKKAKKIEIMP